MDSRMSVDKSILVFRDEVCRICGEHRLEKLTLHHIYPKWDKRRPIRKYHTLLCKRCHKHINLIWNPKNEIEKQRIRGFKAGAGV